jgi:hypothetical protein
VGVPLAVAVAERVIVPSAFTSAIVVPAGMPVPVTSIRGFSPAVATVTVGDPLVTVAAAVAAECICESMFRKQKTRVVRPPLVAIDVMWTAEANREMRLLSTSADMLVSALLITTTARE